MKYPTQLGLALLISAFSTSVHAQDGDWTGFYAGIEAGTASFNTLVPGVGDFKFPTQRIAGHAGYLLDTGKWVYGAEIDVSRDFYTYSAPNPTSASLNGATAKAILGYDLGQFLVYGAIGYSQVTLNSGTVNPMRGIEYAAGVNYQASDHWRIGAEVAQFQDAKWQQGVNGDIAGQLPTFSLRASYTF